MYTVNARKITISLITQKGISKALVIAFVKYWVRLAFSQQDQRYHAEIISLRSFRENIINE